jgi:O-acetylhomoserine aminocarboxypropyltransferase/cysteine synthase
MSKNVTTQVLHAGFEPSANNGSTAVPLYQANAFAFDSCDHAVGVFDLQIPAYLYTRLNNPTTDVLEQRLAALDGGVGAIATASGMSAVATTIFTLLRAGDHIVASSSVYGGTYNLLSVTLPRLGITTTFVDAHDPKAFEAAIQPNTKLVYTETLGNPKLDFVDIAAVANVAHAHGLPLVVDNTLTPILCRPIDHGADIVIYSLTKYFSGNGTAMGGAVVDSGKFDWTNGKFPDFTEPSPGYHGLRYSETFGPAAFIVRARVEGLRDIGACLSPTNSFLIIQGLETLALRIKQSSQSALEVARWLQQHPAVEWVHYPGLEQDEHHEICKRYLDGGFGCIITFGLKGGYEAAKSFADHTKLFRIVANLGDTKSLVIHPSSTTHRQLSPEQQASAGVTPDLVRLSIGLEDIEDLKADIEQAILEATR